MPFKKAGSSNYYIRRQLVGFGDSGTLSTRVKSLRLAQRMERMLVEIAEKALLEERYTLLLEAVRPRGKGQSGALTLPDLLKAYTAGRLPDLLLSITDPTLEEAVDAFLRSVPNRTGSDRRVRRGMRYLLEMAPRRYQGRPTTLAWLRDGRRITELAARFYEAGHTRNSVQVCLVSPISLLLRHHWGEAERDRVFRDVRWRWEDDTRTVKLTPADTQRLLAACRFDYLSATRPRRSDPAELRMVVLLALATGGDRTPIARLRRRDVTLYDDEDGLWATVFYLDTKTRTRSRTAVIGPSVTLELLPYLSDKEEGGRLFTLSPKQMTYYFSVARDRAGLPGVRMKDLRHQFAIAADEAGLSQATIQGAMGHQRVSTTRRYMRYEAVMTPGEASQVAQALGLTTLTKLQTG